MQLKLEFYDALNDYLLLMEKQYPQKATLKLVSDKYKLTSIERSILFRGVVVKQQIVFRKTKTIELLPENGTVTIDGFNVLRTIASYLLGRPVYIAMDGFLRDASEMHGKPLSQRWRIKAFKLLLDSLLEKNLSLKLWFDSPVTKSADTVTELNQIMIEEGISGKASLAHSADYQLKQTGQGVIATADSAIIEQAKVPVIDLAQYVLKERFLPDFFDLRNSINE